MDTPEDVPEGLTSGTVTVVTSIVVPEISEAGIVIVVTGELDPDGVTQLITVKVSVEAG